MGTIKLLRAPGIAGGLPYLTLTAISCRGQPIRASSSSKIYVNNILSRNTVKITARQIRITQIAVIYMEIYKCHIGKISTAKIAIFK